MRRANELMAHRLVTEAYARARDSATPVQRIAQEATAMLQEALKLEPNNVHTLRLLLEAERNSRTPESEAAQKETLRKIIRLDPGDMVAQVAYLDLLASANQMVEEQARVYQAALDSTKLDPQIRSEMAMRLARASLERGDTEQAKAFCTQALSLNDVNVEALRELARLGDRSGPGRLKNLIALVNANPYEPNAWVEISNVLGASGVHDRAAECLVVAIEQQAMSGVQTPGDLYLQLALEYAAAGRTGEASMVLSGLSRLEDAPLSVLMAAELLSHEYAAPARGAQPATQVMTPAMRRAQADKLVAPPEKKEEPAAASEPATQPAEPLPARIVSRLSKAIEAQPKEAGPLAEGVWVELSALPEVTPEAAAWLKTYAGMVPADDAALARLKGWQLLREKKLAEAEAALSKISAEDPLAQLGLARALIEQNKIPEATKQLQDLWNSHPTGLLAFQVAQTARMAHIAMAPTLTAQQMIDAFRELPRRTMTAHRDPKDRELVMVSLPQRVYRLGEPVMVTVRLTNTGDSAVPVGADGVIKTTVGLFGGTRGMNAQSLGMFAVENLQRVYRLEPRGTIEAAVRADSGSLGDLLSLQPTQTLTVGLTAVLVPRGSGRGALTGLGGQTVSVGDFERTGVPLKMDVLQKLVQGVESLPLDQRMLRAELLSALYLAIPKEPEAMPRNAQEASEREGVSAFRGAVVHVLEECVKSPSPLMRAWMLQNIPPGGVNEAIQGAIDAMASDSDRLVRMEWGIRQAVTARMAMKDPAARQRALSGLEKARDAEKDAGVKSWFTMLLEDEKAPAENNK
jgi:tetratricopeptide (TPR) repeat protein